MNQIFGHDLQATCTEMPAFLSKTKAGESEDEIKWNKFVVSQSELRKLHSSTTDLFHYLTLFGVKQITTSTRAEANEQHCVRSRKQLVRHNTVCPQCIMHKSRFATFGDQKIKLFNTIPAPVYLRHKIHSTWLPLQLHLHGWSCFKSILRACICSVGSASGCLGSCVRIPTYGMLKGIPASTGMAPQY